MKVRGGENIKWIQSAATMHFVEKGERETIFVVGRSQSYQRAFSRSRCTRGPIQEVLVHICGLTNLMLHVCFFEPWHGVYGVFSDWLSKRNSWVNSYSTPRIVYGHLLLQTHIHHCCLWPNAPSGALGPWTTKEAVGRPLEQMCVVTVSFQVRHKSQSACSGERDAGLGQ